MGESLSSEAELVTGATKTGNRVSSADLSSALIELANN